MACDHFIALTSATDSYRHLFDKERLNPGHNVKLSRRASLSVIECNSQAEGLLRRIIFKCGMQIAISRSTCCLNVWLQFSHVGRGASPSGRNRLFKTFLVYYKNSQVWPVPLGTRGTYVSQI